MSTVEELDNEIVNIRAQIANLQAHRSNLGSILLSSPQLSTRLEQRSASNDRQRRNASKVVKKQSDRNAENVYRACAGVTAYKVKDPDPNAVDDGNILGVRIEVSVEGRFIDTYHVLFNRPHPRHKTVLKIHKHTVPPCIAIRPLANRFLPMSQKDATTATEQDLLKFGRSLRKEIVAWHLRTAAVERLRQNAGLPDKATRAAEEQRKHPVGQVLNNFVSDGEEDSDEEERRRTRLGPVKIVAIDCDMSVSEIQVTWSDGRSATMKVMKDGRIERGVFRTKEGVRILDMSKRAIGRLEGLVERIRAS
ncbi:Cenp-O kinetochore centromere component-domain-containing protein [Lophiotrema nucula]|uniref:Cenp-O kinetochore centromere component-domain-containing protein n=1 Tax=Lophiotrema nucula TaxID=690887 RepID=A0A6A5YS50_9PLEO|nr:Cenp-O kinetochore centromere component-domain-containing protein [Lophiotrema nucula]